MRVSVTFVEKPWTTNEERRSRHWATRAQRTKQWREAFYQAIRPYVLEVGRWESVRITVQPWQRRGKLADVAAHNPAAKAAIDGIVDAGLIVDDSPKYLLAVTFLPPARGEDALTLTLEGERHG